MKIKDVFILKEAAEDLNDGRTFYDFQEPGVGDYFWDCIIADIESLTIYAGIHKKSVDCFKCSPNDFLIQYTTKWLKIWPMLLLFCPCEEIRHGL